MSQLNDYGQEIFDTTPVSYPLHFDKPTPLHIRIRNMILQQMADSANDVENDTFDEANDFTMDDVPEFSSPYEMEDDFDHMYDEKWDKKTQPSSSNDDSVKTESSSAEDAKKE